VPSAVSEAGSVLSGPEGARELLTELIGSRDRECEAVLLFAAMGITFVGTP